MEFISSTSEIVNHEDIYRFFELLKEKTKDRKGFCYYKYPIAGGLEQHIPDIVIVDYEYGIVAMDIYSYSLEMIESITEDSWVINSKENDSLILKLDDYKENLKGKFQKYREIRDKIKINIKIVLSNIDRSEFQNKFENNIELSLLIFNNFLNINYEDLWNEKSNLKSNESEFFLAVAQGAGPMNSTKKIVKNLKSKKIGESIKLIDSKLASLDRNQHEAAIQIAEGPQCIRGMAGTGKTIILTMKAAILHSRYPDKKILYTFHTQSLYNQIKNLITRFYRESEPKDPNWDNLLILHSWGGSIKEGVYYRTCLRNSIKPLAFKDTPFGGDGLEYVCNQLLDVQLNEEFDYVLIDEAQDLPISFYSMVYKITKKPKRITYAYDELQDLNEIKQKDFNVLFNNENNDNVQNGTYPGDIKREYILEKSYRNPLNILMTAHGLGLGIHNKDQEMQIIAEKETWEAIGYEIEKGELKEGEEIVIKRPTENSVNLVHEIYEGDEKNLIYKKFEDRNAEIDWIIDSIKRDIDEEEILPHDIFVITLDSKDMKNIYLNLQRKLFEKGIPSLIPGIGISRDKFAEYGNVTLSTVYKAKGNEAFMVYIMNFELLYDYVDFIKSRNKAFTSISRSKGWCRITGVGKNMDRAIKEIEHIDKDIPFFKFKYPDPEKIRRLLSKEETIKRSKEFNSVKKLADDLLTKDARAIENLPEDVKKRLKELFKINN